MRHQAGSDGGQRNSAPGRARHKPSNHCAGNAGVLQLYLYARVRIFSHSLHTRPRVQQAPGIPCTLRLRGGDKFMQTSGAIRAARSRNCIHRHRERSEAIHFATCGGVDCVAALAMTWRGRCAADTPGCGMSRCLGRTGSFSRSPLGSRKCQSRPCENPSLGPD